jgi:hypothetical protein
MQRFDVMGNVENFCKFSGNSLVRLVEKPADFG